MNDLEKPLSYHKENLRQALGAREEVPCPCCGQKCKIRKRKLDQHHARALMFTAWLYAQHGIPVHYTAVEHPFGSERRVLTSHYSILKYWGLIEPVNDKHPEYPKIEHLRRGDPDVPGSGYYVPTPTGMAFANGELLVSKYRDRFNSHTVKSHGDLIGIKDLEGEWFNWQEMMDKMI
jgi:hypothetical protein